MSPDLLSPFQKAANFMLWALTQTGAKVEHFFLVGGGGPKVGVVATIDPVLAARLKAVVDEYDLEGS